MKAITSWKTRLRDDKGNVLVIAALSMTVLLGFAAMGTDIGVLFYVRRSAQTAADCAAITGAQEFLYGDAVAAAKADAARNGFTDGSNGVTVTVNTPPVNGPHAGVTGYVEVIVARTQATYFMSVFNRKSMVVKARSVGAVAATQNCVYTLGTAGTDISVTNGVQVDLSGCNMYGNSTSNSDFSASGGAHLTAANINLVGNQSVSNGAHITATVNTGVTAVSDPLAYLTPPSYLPSSCVADPVHGTWGTYTVGPASGGSICYNGLNIANGASVSLRPGVYIINGALTFGGGVTINGTGITFYLPPGASLNIGNGINETLKAPTSGTYNGVLFYQDRQNSTAESLQGGASSIFEGIMYFPAANFTFTNGTSTATYASIISKSLSFSGGAKVQNYALKNAGTPLAAPRLVE